MNHVYSFFIITALVFGLVTSPLSYGQSNQEDFTNLGQEVSDFVHESRKSFEEQKSETKEVIAKCREDLAAANPSEREAIRDQCKSDLNDIGESYRSLRETYRETFLTFKENIKVLIAEAKGLPVGSGEIKAAISNIQSVSDDDKQDLLKELRKKIKEEIKEESHNLRDLEKKERETARQELKAEKKELREQLKQQLESIKEQVKSLREDESESEDEHDEDEHDEDFIIKGIATLVNEMSEYFKINEHTIYVNDNTEFDDFNSLEDIQGFNVTVKVIQSSNSLIAKEIQINDGNHHGDNGEMEDGDHQEHDDDSEDNEDKGNDEDHHEEHDGEDHDNEDDED